MDRSLNLLEESDSENSKIKISLLGKSHRLLRKTAPDNIDEIAKNLDDKMRLIRDEQKTGSFETIATTTALNLERDLIAQTKKIDSYRFELDNRIRKLINRLNTVLNDASLT